jgi:hypothetical protein
MKWDNVVTLCKEKQGECSPIVTRLWAGYLRNFGFIPDKGKRFIYLFSRAYRAALEFIQSSIQYVLQGFCF